jgi:hypothetical protein
MRSNPSSLFRHLGDHHRALIESLRHAVTPVLANNLLPHFTDHSVDHSDRLTTLVDELIQPIQPGQHALSQTELAVLYAACYLHDIGMQNENAGSTRVISELALPHGWDSLSEDQRRDLLRQHHNRISAEMVQRSATGEAPLAGMTLSRQLQPTSVANLCRAHTIDTESPEYEKLMSASPSLRMPLLSGLLRMADILDESLDRAQPEKARTLRLGVDTQIHWYRHYYTEGVVIDQHEKTIRVCFDFPSAKEREYGAIVPELQMPPIRRELARHELVFHKYGLGWTLVHSVASNEYGIKEVMPEPVLTAMLKHLFDLRQKTAEVNRQAVLRQFEEAQPSFERRLVDAERKHQDGDVTGWLRELAQVCAYMWEMGGKRSAWTTLHGPFIRNSQMLQPVERVKLGTDVARLMIDDDAALQAADLLVRLRPTADALSDNEPAKIEFYRVLVPCFLANFDLGSAREAWDGLCRFPAAEDEKHRLKTQLREATLLSGGMSAPDVSESATASAPGSCTRDHVVAARWMAMTGDPQGALGRLDEAVARLDQPEQQEEAVALLNLKAEILALSCRDQEALVVFQNDIDKLLAGCCTETKFTIASNRSVLTGEAMIVEDAKVNEFYHQVDARRLAHFDLWDTEAFASAQEDAEAGRHLDALQTLWRELLRANRRGSWLAARFAARRLAKHWLLAKRLKEAAFYAVLGGEESTAQQVADSVIAARDPQAVSDAVDAILGSANLVAHAKMGAEMISRLADVIPDERVYGVFSWLLSRGNCSPGSRRELSAVESIWDAIRHLSNRLDEGHAETAVRAALAHACWSMQSPGRRTLVRVVNSLLPAIPKPLLERVVSHALPLAGDLACDFDYPDVLDLLVHAAKLGGDDVASRIKAVLAPSGSRVSNLHLAGAVHHFGAGLDAAGLHTFVLRLAEDIRNQVQHVPEGETPARPLSGSYGAVHSTGSGPRPTVQILGGSLGLNVVLAHKLKLQAEDLEALIRVCLHMIADPDNLIENKSMLVQAVGQLGDSPDCPLAAEVLEALLPLSKSTMAEPSIWQSHAAAQDPLSRFKIDMGSPFDLQAAALHAVAKLVRSHPGLDAHQVHEALTDGCLHASAEVRRAAMYGLGSLVTLPAGAVRTLLMGTRDEDSVVAQVAYLALESRPGTDFDDMDWYALLYSIARALRSGDARSRWAAAHSVCRLLPGAPAGAVTSALLQARDSLASDTSFLVRSAALGRAA